MPKTIRTITPAVRQRAAHVKAYIADHQPVTAQELVDVLEIPHSRIYDILSRFADFTRLRGREGFWEITGTTPVPEPAPTPTPEVEPESPKPVVKTRWWHHIDDAIPDPNGHLQASDD